MTQTFYSNGKLLLSSEYAVLDGAKALALPTTFGQTLNVTPLDSEKLIWKSLDYNNNIWFEQELTIDHLISSFSKENDKVSQRLYNILIAAKQLNPDFLNTQQGYEIVTKLEFPQNWGLGSSSTLINNMAQWAKIDAFDLLEQTFGGSGYDIACAQNNSAITYQLIKGKPNVENISFNPEFKNHLYFVHLNKKQDSREAMATYRSLNQGIKADIIDQLNLITKAIIDCDGLDNFCKLIDEHESIISTLLKISPIKDQLFSDFEGSIKSLGAWGGDFVLAASNEDPTYYFKDRGFSTILSYENMIL